MEQIVTALQQLIIERIRREGPVSFASFMRMALYEPGYGYYVTGAAKMGWEGDYFTSADVSAFFAHCIGRQLAQWWESLGRPMPFCVLEQGAGRGNLAQGVQSWAETEAQDFCAALDYRIADIHNRQDALGATALSEGTVESETTDLLEPVHVILSNELVDAFPVHVVEARDRQLYEIFVDEQDGQFYPFLSEPESDEVAHYLDRFKIPWQGFDDGWRAEINLDALRWIRQAAQLVRRGYILTIDYGDKARELYTRSRRHGTLSCYFHQQMNEQPLARPGEQDITAHVNFSALIDEGRLHGLHLNTYTTQRAWLEKLGIREELERRRTLDFAEMDSARATDRGQIAMLKWQNLAQRVAVLTDPAGMGNFKVLVMRR
jgi:SAM-dependent MidA family methyltransferase